MSAAAVGAAGQAWHHQLVRTSAEGCCVAVASMHDRDEVSRLLLEMMAESSAFSRHGATGEQCRRWVDGLLPSIFWLFLLLKDERNEAFGIAVCEYIAYDVDINSRVLKCKQFYVRQRQKGSLLAPSKLLLDAIIEAARRSPKLRDVFIVSTGARAFHRLGQPLCRQGFRRIGTQHIGTGRARPRAHGPDLKSVHSVAGLSPGELRQLHDLSHSFFKESARSSLGSIAFNFDRLLDHALGQAGPPSKVLYLAYREGELAGFLAGCAGSPALTSLRYLHSSFFYVAPRHRGSHVALSLFDAFTAHAIEQGLQGSFFGTSSEIATDRAARLLSLRGYAHCGDVWALRVGPGGGV